VSKITELTPDQEAELPIFRQHYLDIATTGGRIDRPALEAALTDAYAEIGKPAPRLFIFDSPAECLLAIKIFQMPEGDNLRDNLVDNLGDNLGANLRANLGANLWANLRANLRANLMDNLGANLWDNLRANLRDNLRDNLGDNLRDNLWNPNFLWGSQDIYWIAWFRFAEKIGCVFTENDARRLNIMERISTQCEWWWPFEGTVFASQRPSVTRDDEGRIHRENGMAVKYRGGYGLSFWHGQVIPNEWVAGNPPTAAEALHWPNMDQRSAACEIVGWHNILDQLKARIVDDSDDPVWGRLVEVDLPGSGKERFLDALCGTGRRFALPVPPKTKTVDEAQSVLHGGLPVEILKHCVERT
jgi:hypothetical protein